MTRILNCAPETFEVDIESLASDGRGVGRYNNQVVFIPRSVPGQKTLASLTGRQKNYLEARVVSILASSSFERRPLCSDINDCGGCDWQHIDYRRQLYWKRRIVMDALDRIGRVKGYECFETIGSPQEWHYRNKMEFAFAPPQELGGPCLLGLRKSRSHQVAPVKECLLSAKPIAYALEAVRRWTARENLSVKSDKNPRGYLRFLVVRASKSGDCLVELIVNSEYSRRIDEGALGQSLRRYLQKECPYVTGVVLSRRSSLSDIASGESMVWSEGNYFLEETIGAMRLKIRYDTFFQVNTEAARLLYAVIQDFAQLTGKELVWDLYAGIGSIGLFLAPLAREVLCVEESKASVDTARDNAKRLGYSHCKFEACDMQSFMKNVAEKYPKPGVAVVDPPRAGLDAGVKEALKRLAPAKCVYVSCNPGTLARDVACLSDRFRLLKTQPVDLFPQTPHIETVSLLESRDA